MNTTVKPSPLGRGLSALFGDADNSYAPKPAAPAVVAASVAEVPREGTTKMNITWLQPGAFQPRRHFDEDALKGLTDSVRERGVLEPLVVRPVAGTKDAYEIIAGERRWRAAQKAGLHQVPVVVRELTDREALEFGLIENVQRQDLSPLEEAEGYKRLLDEFNHTQEGLAKIVGKSRPHIANLLRILTLPASIKTRIESGELTLGHARAIITSRDPVALADVIAKRGLNVRQAEALAKRENDNPQIHKRKATNKADADVIALEKELERVIGLKVKIAAQGKSGAITFYYHDLDQLDNIIKKLRG
ncbi:MAG: ParB/RepB/Spo0J family partition protein [Alphaproteobacteria bacterium]|nr:ParB/RepB/Spo0J family partition protein [Alphaproteobacteria bacterium]MBV8548270.1 ParB/RepB/Spo0J family partition protein [Alphaproteobacteria bacterium]